MPLGAKNTWAMDDDPMTVLAWSLQMDIVRIAMAMAETRSVANIDNTARLQVLTWALGSDSCQA